MGFAAPGSQCFWLMGGILPASGAHSSFGWQSSLPTDSLSSALENACSVEIPSSWKSWLCSCFISALWDLILLRSSQGCSGCQVAWPEVQRTAGWEALTPAFPVFPFFLSLSFPFVFFSQPHRICRISIHLWHLHDLLSSPAFILLVFELVYVEFISMMDLLCFVLYRFCDLFATLYTWFLRCLCHIEMSVVTIAPSPVILTGSLFLLPLLSVSTSWSSGHDSFLAFSQFSFGSEGMRQADYFVWE